jgi:hypothetical protein
MIPLKSPKAFYRTGTREKRWLIGEEIHEKKPMEDDQQEYGN